MWSLWASGTNTGGSTPGSPPENCHVLSRELFSQTGWGCGVWGGVCGGGGGSSMQ